MRIFLISGKGGHGKNTVAKLIKEFYDQLDEKTVITAYAKYIKMFAKEVSGWDGSEETKPRALLQMIGSKVRDEIREDFFTNRLREDILFYQDYFKNVVIADVRLPHEIERMREIFPDTYAIKVHRADVIDNLNEKEKEHITEIALDNYHRFDYEIENTTIEELKDKVYEILSGIN